MDQAEETRQMEIEKDIGKNFDDIYKALQTSDNIKAEEVLGHIAVAKAIWEDDEGSFA